MQGRGFSVWHWSSTALSASAGNFFGDAVFPKPRMNPGDVIQLPHHIYRIDAAEGFGEVLHARADRAAVEFQHTGQYDE